MKIIEKIYIQKIDKGTVSVMTEFTETTVEPQLSGVIMGRGHMDKWKLQLIYSLINYLFNNIINVYIVMLYSYIKT